MSSRSDARGAAQPSLRIHSILLWLLFFLISMGLGYATLNRYDPRNIPGLYDAKAYCAMVAHEPLQPDQADLGHRILVPYLARPVYELAKDRIGTWNPALFALLVVNSLFTAITALLIVLTGRRFAADSLAPVLGAFLFLGNFAVANLNLAGYVDSAVNCLLMAVVWSMLTNRLWLLPVFGVLGALAKETFVPMCICLVFAWWILDRNEGARKMSRLVWIIAMAIAAVISLTLVMAWVPPAESPLAFAASRHADSGRGLLSGLIGCLTAREFLFTFCG